MCEQQELLEIPERELEYCQYRFCHLGEDGGPKILFGKQEKYCCDKHGHKERKLLKNEWKKMGRLGAFIEFHTENPVIYNCLVAMLLFIKPDLDKPISITPLYEMIRNLHQIKSLLLGSIPLHIYDLLMASQGLKLSNNHKPYYARLIKKKESALREYVLIHECDIDESKLEGL